MVIEGATVRRERRRSGVACFVGQALWTTMGIHLRCSERCTGRPIVITDNGRFDGAERLVSTSVSQGFFATADWCWPPSRTALLERWNARRTCLAQSKRTLGGSDVVVASQTHGRASEVQKKMARRDAANSCQAHL